MSDLDTSAGYQEGQIGVPQPDQDASQTPPGGQPQGDAPQQPDQQQAPPPEQQDQPKGDRLTALISERRSRRSETADLRDQVRSLQDTVSGLSPRAQEQAEAWKNPHDPVEAPMDHLRAEIEHLGGVVNQARADVGEQLTQQQQRQALSDYERNVSMELQGVAQEVPELGQAHQAVAQHFMRTAQMQGYQGAQAAEAARNAMLGAYLQHAQAGNDSVSATVQMAQALGFQAQQPAGILGNGAQPNGTAPQVARGQRQAASSLGGATGSSGASAPPDLQQLARMGRDKLRANGGEYLQRLKAQLRGET